MWDEKGMLLRDGKYQTWGGHCVLKGKKTFEFVFDYII